jgi:acetyl-CoA C-acetyltransferase
MGAYAAIGNQEMLTAALRGVVDRHALHGQRLGDVGAGAVLKHSRDFNLVRECVLSAGLDPQTPGLDLQRACGTSLEAAICVGNKIALGQIDSRHRGRRRYDQRSRRSVYPRAYQQLLLRSAPRPQRLGAHQAVLRPAARHFKPVLPGVIEPRTGLSMGRAAN